MGANHQQRTVLMVLMAVGVCFCLFSLVYHDLQWDADSSTTLRIASHQATEPLAAKRPSMLPQHENHQLENSATLLESVASLVQQHVRSGNARPAHWTLESVISVAMFGSDPAVEETRDQQLGELLVQQPLPVPVQPTAATSAAHVAMMRRQRAAAGAASSNLDAVASAWNGAAAASQSNIEQLRAAQAQTREQQRIAAMRSALVPSTGPAAAPTQPPSTTTATTMSASAIPSALFEDPRGAAMLHAAVPDTTSDSDPPPTPRTRPLPQVPADAPRSRGGALGGFEAESAQAKMTAPTRRRRLQQDLGSARIPRIIHQIYFPGQDAYLAATRKPNAFLQTAWRDSCRIHHPDWSYIFWNISMAEALIQRRMPSFLSAFRAYPTDMYRADAFRYIILNEIGGLYLDLDVECWRASDSFLQGSQFVAQGHGTLEPLANGMIASIPTHPIWGRVMEKLVANAQLPLSFMENDARRVLHITGPRLFSAAVMEMLGIVDQPPLMGRHTNHPELGVVTVWPITQWLIPCQLFNNTCFEAVAAARGEGRQPLAELAGHHRYSRAWDSLRPQLLKVTAHWEDM